MRKKLAIITVVTLAGLRLYADVTTVNPGDYTTGTALTTIVPQLTLSTCDQNNAIEPLFTVEAFAETTGSLAGISVFSSAGVDFWNNSQRLRIDFDEPTTALQIEIIGNSNMNLAIGTLDVYDSVGDLLGQYTTSGLTKGESEIMTVSGLSPTAAAYAVATGNNGSFSRLTNLQVTQTPEPTAVALLLAGLSTCLPRRRLRKL